MQIAHHRLGALIEHVGVDLRRRDVGMAEQILNDAQVRAILQQMTGEGVAKHVRAHARGRNSRCCGDSLEITREGLTLMHQMLPRYYKAAEMVWGPIPPQRARQLVAELAAVSRTAEFIARNAAKS